MIGYNYSCSRDGRVAYAKIEGVLISWPSWQGASQKQAVWDVFGGTVRTSDTFLGNWMEFPNNKGAHFGHNLHAI